MLMFLLGSSALEAQTFGNIAFGTITTNPTTGYSIIPIRWINIPSPNITAINIEFFISGQSVCLDANLTKNSVAPPFTPGNVIIGVQSISLQRNAATILPSSFEPLLTLYIRAQPGTTPIVSVGNIHSVMTSSGFLTIVPPVPNSLPSPMTPYLNISGQAHKPPMPDGDTPETCYGGGNNSGIPDVNFLFQTNTGCFPDPRGPVFKVYSANGDYSTTLPSYYSYSITPSKAGDTDGDKANNTNCACGVNEDDIVQGRKFVLGIITDAPSLQQVIAADVNGDGTVTTADLGLMRNCLSQIESIQLPPTFQWWRFMPEGYYNFYNVHPINPTAVPPLPGSLTTSAVTSNLPQTNFYGIKLGDIVGQGCIECVGTDGFALSVTERATAPTKDLAFDDLALEAGREYLVPIRADKMEGLIYCGVELMFDPRYLEIVQVEQGILSETEASHSVRAEGGADVLRYVWFSMQLGGENSEDQAALFYLRVRAKRAATSLQGLIWQRSSDRLNTAVFADGATTKLSLRPAPAMTKYFVARLTGANPAHAETEVTLYMPAAAEVFISILDLNGGLASRQRIAATTGWNTVAIKDLPATPGLYALHILSEFGQASVRLIKQ